MVTASVLGASGYSGAELRRLLARHDQFELVGLAGGRSEGVSVETVHPHLAGFPGVLMSIEPTLALETGRQGRRTHRGPSLHSHLPRSDRP